ncbi:MAG: DNA replication/repair protein RecF [Ornithinimicrobium sp.]
MRLTRVELADFRGYQKAEVVLPAGVSTLLGRNGQGKTNFVEAVGYVATLASHRVAGDAPLVRYGCDRAVIRAEVVRESRSALVEIEIVTGRANRARLNRSPVSRQREVLGTVRTILFAPEDLALVKADPSERRRFLDDLLVARQPRWQGVRQDYDKALKQRNALLKSQRTARRSDVPSDAATLAVFDSHLAQIGGALTYARLRLLRDLVPFLQHAYAAISDSTTAVSATYRPSWAQALPLPEGSAEMPDAEDIGHAMMQTMQQWATEERERGVSLVGPHRDEVYLALGEMPARGYASHGESWSIALALRLASFFLLRRDLSTDPVLILDDVFAELDTGRRERLAEMVADCEQVLVTAAVPQDVPSQLGEGTVFEVDAQTISARERS